MERNWSDSGFYAICSGGAYVARSLEGDFNFVRGSKMKYRMKLWFAMCMSLTVTACTIGNGHICGPQTPIAYCDSEAYQKLMHPKPYLHYWEKSEMTSKGRRQDWMDCGGFNDGSFSPYIGRLKEEMRPEEKDHSAAHLRLENDLQRCMIKKGYRFTGECSYRKNFPACGAP